MERKPARSRRNPLLFEGTFSNLFDVDALDLTSLFPGSVHGDNVKAERAFDYEKPFGAMNEHDSKILGDVAAIDLSGLVGFQCTLFEFRYLRRAGQGELHANLGNCVVWVMDVDYRLVDAGQ